MSNMPPTHSTRTATIAAMSGSGSPSEPMNATVPLNWASFWNPLSTKITESRSRPRKAAASLVGDMALLHLLAGLGSLLGYLSCTQVSENTARRVLHSVEGKRQSPETIV